MEVVVNAAMSVDGKLAPVGREGVRISGDADFDRVMDLRTRADAIVVGSGTLLADDPRLTARDGEGDLADAQPLRVVLDARARTPVDSNVLDDSAATLIFVGAAVTAARRSELENDTTSVLAVDGDTVTIPTVMSLLSVRGVETVLVEGGGDVIFSCFEAGVVDRLSVYIGNCIIGGRTAPTLADGTGFDESEAFPRLELAEVTQLDDGLLLEWVP